jgi:hypothetical protein
LQLLGLFYTYPQTQTFFIKQSLAANFYSLPMIAECSVERSLQFVTPTFTVIFSSIPLKKPKANKRATLTKI